MVSNAQFMLNIVINVVNKATSPLKTIDDATQKIDKNIGKINKRMGTFDMRLLSLLFGGMALKRAFGGINRSIFDTFNRAEDKQSGLAQATNRLGAAWEFFKFSIMDALNTDFFINVIDGVIRFVNWLSQLDSEFKVTFLTITTGLFVIGTGLMLIGQFKLFWDAVFGMDGFLRSTNKIHAKTLGSGGVFTALKTFAAVGLAIKAFFDIDKFVTGKGGVQELISSMGTSLILAGLIFSGKRWLLPIGVFLKLLPAAKDISEFGKNFAKGSIEQIQTAFKRADDFKGQAPNLASAKNVGSLLTGIGKTGVGFAIEGFGTLLELTNVAIEDIGDVDTQTETLATSMDETLVPSINNTVEQIDGKEGSLIGALNKTGTEMDTLSGEKTDGFITASNDRISQLDSEISKYNEFIEKQKEAFSDFGNSIGLGDRNTSSVSD